MSGTVNISRRLFSSEAFRDEPFTEREAWVWLVMEASWKDRTVRAGDYVTETKRGQLAASVRFMAKAWSWTPAKAQRYLKRLEKMKMIRSKSDTGVSVITVCNYNEYQGGGKASDTDAIQMRYRTDTNEKKDERREEGKEEEPYGSLSQPHPVDEIADAVSAYNAAAARAGWPSMQKLTPQRRASLKARIKDSGGAEGWRAAMEKAEASDFLCGRKPIRGDPFFASFDFLIRQSSFTKLMEGSYDNRTQSRQSSADDSALRSIARAASMP